MLENRDYPITTGTAIFDEARVKWSDRYWMSMKGRKVEESGKASASKREETTNANEQKGQRR